MTAPKDEEAVLSSVVSLATLFSNCVEAFGRVHPTHFWDKQEQLLLTHLGIQQARLLIWGDVLGISSPPANIATSFVPTSPGAMNPDPNEAVYFTARDSRLDEPGLRKKVEDALHHIVDRPAHLDREEMMELYGLRPSKKVGPMGVPSQTSALDTTRLEGFREKYALLLDVAAARANLASPRRGMSIVGVLRWEMKDLTKFWSFIQLIREQVDLLVELFSISSRVDRAVKMDIKALGWHPEATRTQAAKEISKLKLLQEACQQAYPQYSQAAQEALDNLNDAWKGRASYVTPPETPPPKVVSESPLIKTKPTTATPEKKKRPLSFLSLFSRRSSTKSEKGRSKSLAVPSNTADDPQRSKSEAIPSSTTMSPPLEPTRSKSVSAVPDNNSSPKLVPVVSKNNPEGPVPDSAKAFDDLTQVQTVDDQESVNLTNAKTFQSMISRHDQFRDEYSVR